MKAPTPFSLRGGSLVALPTPFRADRTIDDLALQGLCLRQIQSGTSALVVCTTTGESASLSGAEQRQVIEVAVAAAGGRIPVIAGAGACDTATAVMLARQAETAGAAALLCVTPYYVRPSQAGVVLHMRAIHDAVGVPLILYDVPARTSCALSDETVAHLAELPRVIGLKDATGDIARVARLRAALRRDFLLLSGDDVTQARHRRAGGDGCISVTANVTPAFCAEMHAAWDHGDTRTFDRAAEILDPLNRALFVETNPIPVKHALATLGLIQDTLRLPLTPLESSHVEAVQREVRAVQTATALQSGEASDHALAKTNAALWAQAFVGRHTLRC